MAQKINTSQSGGWWEELGRASLSSPADSLTVSSLSPRKFIQVIVISRLSGTSNNMLLRFNGDSGTNYDYRASNDGGADGVATAQNAFSCSLTQVGSAYMTADILNMDGIPKMVKGTNYVHGVPGNRREFSGRWNASQQISSVTLVNSDVNGDFGAGTELIVLGHN